MTPDEKINEYIAMRYTLWQEQLDQFSDEALIILISALNTVKKELLQQIRNHNFDVATASDHQLLSLTEQIFSLTSATQGFVASSLAHYSAIASIESVSEYTDILSMGGQLKINGLGELSIPQIQHFIEKTPVGGDILSGWVNRAFDETLKTKIQQDILSGYLKGEGYPKLVKRYQEGFDELTHHEIVTLTRTYVQSANVGAMVDVYQKNTDIVKKVKWSCSFELGYKSSGTGTCLTCAALDGQTWGINEPHPPCPEHPRCRCVLLPVTPSWDELGIDMEELEKPMRQFKIQEDKSIDTGGKRKVFYSGKMQGDYEDFFKTLKPKQQLAALGPKRYELYKQGKVKFKDFVDSQTGELKTLKELK